VGKTHLAVALGMTACEQGRRVLFTTAMGLIASLGKALAENRLDEKLKLLTHPHLLIIDEIGYIPIDRQGANLFFQLVSRRYERGAIILTSNQSLGAWGEVFGDPVIATAILDRLLHHSITVKEGLIYSFPDSCYGWRSTKWEPAMKQQTFADASFEPYRKSTRRERFLDEMNRVVPWADLVAAIEPRYPKAEGPGRPPVGIERMLRLHCLQQWFNLSDPAVEEALYDSRAMRQFVGIDLGREPVPDETTICKFRHLLEAHELGKQLFTRIGTYLAGQGVTVRRGTIVDATIISAPSSTKNRQKARDPEMRQTKKGNQWYFGMKAHVGVDSRAKLIHSVAATAANVHDSQALPELLHGNETRVWGDAAYSGQREVIRQQAPDAKSFLQAKAHRHRSLSEVERARNRTKSKVRAKIEHVFGVMKRVFGWTKVRYRGLVKNTNWLFVTCGLTNLYLARRRLLAGT